MELRYSAYSHQGKVRKCNEDYYFIPDPNDPLQNLMMVADGMGGHNAGDLASKMVVENVVNYFRIHNHSMNSLDQIKDSIYESIQQANSIVYHHSKTDAMYFGMGTTLTLVYAFNKTLCVGHVGDSRCYLIRGKNIFQITKDHSLVQELLENGSITKEEVNSHPQKNVITRALGTDDLVEIDYYEVPLEDDDIVLLCTDGLIHHIKLEQHIELLTACSSLDDITTLLAQKALKEGGIDNITVLMSKYSVAKRKE